ncbi:MAG TPA: metalloregulator ArsR/SmtB family transcription factor [Thermomicrobiaceae bacterium]|nr:metalloregulator ArsR/SmtB family transcription factor [Thermomicrobiaceae bacterium]
MARPRRVDQLRAPEAAESACEEQIVHVDAVRTVRASMPTSVEIGRASALFSALGDPTRLRLMTALASHPLCVCDLAAALGTSQSAVSHQLRVLRQQGLVRSARDGRRVYYALDDEHVTALVGQALAHARHAGEADADA